MNFEAIFKEYYAIFRGQASNIPSPGEREHTVGLQLANNAIKKWDRADGTLWRELWTTAQVDGSGDLTVSAGSSEYSAPTNMRKPPAFVKLVNSDGGYTRVKVVDPHEIQNFGSGLVAYFTGSANKGYTLHLDGNLSSVDGFSIDFPYIKKPTMMTANTSKPDMSDPNFMIHDMVATRAANARNGFLYKTSKADATVALQNMKIENNSGTFGNSDNLGDAGAGFGTIGGSNDIQL